MGKVTMAGTGGGADLDVITAAANDVLAGKIIVGPDGEPLTGTLALSGTAADSQVLSGQTYYNTDAKTKRTGTMLTMAGQTITPGAAQQTVSCAGRYMTGNIVVSAVNRYGYYSGMLNTVGGRTFNKRSGGTVSLPYLSFAPGFTPVICIAQKAGEAVYSMSTPWNHINVDNKQAIDISGLMNAGGTIFPVISAGSYSVWLAGYY